MNRWVVIIGALLVLLGGSVFFWKTAFLGLPLSPANPEGLWQVDLEISARGEGRRGSVRAVLPVSGDGQLIFDEHHTNAEDLTFSLREAQAVRVGVWSGRFSGVHSFLYSFRAQLWEVVVPLPSGVGGPVPADLRRAYLAATGDYPSNASAVTELLERLRLPAPEDSAARLRALYTFVTDEITTAAGAGDDPLLALAQREASEVGTERLLATLLRAAGIPARLALGLQLNEGGYPPERAWVEAWLDGTWVPLSASQDFFGRRPAGFLLLRTGYGETVGSSGVRALVHRHHALRERLRSDELAAMMLPTQPVLRELSLYRLPVSLQTSLRLLLLLPLGALITALFRNVIGVPTFGTFMPVLIALALRTSTLGRGLALIGVVLLLGIFGRLLLERLRLLMVPRLSVLLCLVVLVITGLSLLSGGRGAEPTAGVLLPIVILTMLIERFSISMAEEGVQSALIKFAYSLLVAVVVYPVFRSMTAEHLMFGFPELVFVAIGVLIWIGGYTGYRVSDWLRFRVLARLAVRFSA